MTRPQSIFNILDFGAVADGLADDAGAIQRAVDACTNAGGGQVLIPPGVTMRAGSFALRSRVDFHVAAGARLLSAINIEAFPKTVFSSGPESDKRLWIECREAVDVSLSGTGTIDGQCHSFVLEEKDGLITRTERWRPAMTCFVGCRNVTVRDLRFRDSANWTLHFAGCENVTVTDVNIFNDPVFPNADGIDPDHCKNVRISGCRIVSGDDCIVLKNTESFVRYGDCEDIVIEDCHLESASSAFKIGSDSHNAFRRIRVSRCVIANSNRGLTMQIRDGGSVEDVTFEDITIQTRRFAAMWWGAGEAVSITVVPRNGTGPGGSVEGVSFRNVRSQGANGIVLFADQAGAIRDLSFQNCRVEVVPDPEAQPLLDLRPCTDASLPQGAKPIGEPTPWGRAARIAPSGLLARGIRDINTSGLELTVPAGWAADH